MKNFSKGINPVTIETMNMLVGDERLQYVFTDGLDSDREVEFTYGYNAKADALEDGDGKDQITFFDMCIKHMTLGIEGIRPKRDDKDYKRWAIAGRTQRLEKDKAYYLYAVCSKAEESSYGTFYAYEEAMDDTYEDYYFLVGILTAVMDGERSFARMYGFTEVSPARIVTEKIISSDGKTWLDLLRGILHLNDKAGVSGVLDENKGDKSIAAWFGGQMEDKELDKEASNPASAVIRHDGTGYFAKGNFRWDEEGGAEFGGGDLKIFPDGTIQLKDGIKLSTNGDETLGAILSVVSQIKDWFYLSEDGKSIGTKYDFFSEKEVSANGLNLGNGGAGGGLIKSVLGASDLGRVAYEDNSTTFNAYAIDYIYKRLVNIENNKQDVDLSDYFTKEQTTSAITTALVPYIKTSDADNKYAPLAGFNTLKSDFDKLNKALNDDVSGKINTWNEIVDFLDEYNGSEDLATILSKMTTDINSCVKISDYENLVNDRITPLETKVNTNTNNISKILGWFDVDSDGNLFTTYNFYSPKEISANGLNNGSGGSGAGLVSAVLGATSLGATLANDNSVVFNAYATNEVYKVTQSNASRIGVLESQVGRLETSFGDGKFLPLSGGNVDSLTINGNAVIHAGNIGEQSVNFANSTEKWNAINQNKDANDYVCQHAWVNTTSPSSKHLPTIGSRTAGTILDISNSVSHLQLFCGYQAGDGLWYRGCYDSSWYDWNRLVISSELGALAYKNGLNGSDVGLGNVENVALSTWNGSTNIATLGTITSGTWNGSKIANAYLANSAITIAGNSVSLGGSIGASAITEALIGSGNSFVHTANYDKYALSLTGGDLTGAIRFLNSAGITFVGSESATNDTGDLIFRSFNNTEIGRIWLDTSLDFMLRYGSNDESKYILHSGNIEDYNAGSATKLKISRTIWGQGFNGEDNVYGAFSGATTGDFSSNVNIGGSLKVSDTLKAESNAFFGNAFDYGFCIARAAVDVPYTFLALQSKGTYKADIFRVYNDYSVQFIHPTTFNTIKIGGATLSWDGTALKVDKSFYSEEEVSADGLNLNASLPSISITDIMGKTAIGDSNSFIYWTGTRWMTSTLGSNAFSSEQYLPSYGGTIAGNLTINNTITAANGVISGSLSAKTLTLTSTDSVSHISFSRASANYISAPSGGYIGFITNGRGVTLNNASLIISSSDNIIYCGTNNMMQLGYGERRWSGIYATNGDFSGDLVAGTFKTTSTVACGGRLRITSSNGPNSFGFFTATAHSSALNIGIMNIGTNYGGASSIDSTAVDVVAMSLYRGIVGIGRAYTYEEFKTQYNSSIKLSVDGNVSVAGTVTQASDIRKKYVLEPINLSLSEIANAPLFTFKWNYGTDNNVHLGTSAQYWEGVTPWLVSGSDFKGLDYASLGVAMGISLAKKTQELENRVKLLEDRLNN